MFKNLFKKKESEISEIAKNYRIRVSKPYGYYPEDVDAILETLTQKATESIQAKEKLEADYENVIKKLKNDIRNLERKNDSLKTEILRLKTDFTLLEVKDRDTDVITPLSIHTNDKEFVLDVKKFGGIDNE